MTQRYFVEAIIADDRATLSGSEAHHLIHVMRCHTGDEVTLFDGSGAEFLARVDRLGRTEAELAVLARHEVDRELPLPVVLAVALPKGDRQRWLVEKAVELGVSRLIPLETTRGVAQPDDKSLARLRRSVVEASKQCGRNRLMEIGAAVTWNDFAETPPPKGLRLVAHFGGEPIGAIARRLLDQAARPAAVTAAIGPEGGFTDEEAKLACSLGWQTVDLGPRTLRVETAAIMLVSVVALCG